MPILLYGIVALAYAGLALHFWRTRWTASSAQHRAPDVAPWERIAILGPLLVHSWLLYQALFATAELRFGFGFALSCMLWLAVLIYWLESLFVKVEGLQALVLGVAAVCAPLPALFPGIPTPPDSQSLEFRLHMALAMLAYSLFTIAALHAMLMTLVERRLHHRGAGHTAEGPLAGPLAGLPPLLTLERLLFRLIGLGFALLTLTLATGMLNSEEIFGKPISFNHKTLFAVISWFIFAALLGGRYLYGWRGRVALRWTLAGFVTLLLAYVGSRFVLEVILKRGSLI